MPVKEYFHGKGDKVLRSMRKKYGDEEGERVFYATAAKTGMRPKKPKGRKIIGGSK